MAEILGAEVDEEGYLSDSGGDAEMGELPSFFRHPIQIWRAVCCGAEGLNIAVAEIVGVDDNEVRLCLFGCFG